MTRDDWWREVYQARRQVRLPAIRINARQEQIIAAISGEA